LAPFIGQILLISMNFAPSGWLPCNGQLLSVTDYEALFMLIGNKFGGDGQKTFALPNLQSVAPGGCMYVIAVQGLLPQGES
jgi:microcystin-dependent protein